MSLPAQFRCLTAADFQRVMRTRPLGRSPHFMVHFLPAVDKLSTAHTSKEGASVDDTAKTSNIENRLGFVLPKRMVRRAVTRALIRHQARDLWFKQIAQPAVMVGPPGDWVLRVVSPWSKAQYPSAASESLKQVVRQELAALLQSCRQRLQA